MSGNLVATFGPKGLEYIAPTFKHMIEGAKLAPRPEPVVTPRDVAKTGREKRV